MSVAATMQAKLTKALVPESLEIVDESHLHAGHAGHDPRGESHFSITIVSVAFEGEGRVGRQRLVYKILAEELADRVHALSVRTMTPAEMAAET